MPTFWSKSHLNQTTGCRDINNFWSAKTMQNIRIVTSLSMLFKINIPYSKLILLDSVTYVICRQTEDVINNIYIAVNKEYMNVVIWPKKLSFPFFFFFYKFSQAMTYYLRILMTLFSWMGKNIILTAFTDDSNIPQTALYFWK